MKTDNDALPTREQEAIQLPRRFPATLRVFLRLVVRAKTQDVGTKRLRDYYRHRYSRWLSFRGTLAPEDADDVERRAVSEIAAWNGSKENRNTFTAEKWHKLAGEYLAWWTTHKSEMARQSALKRIKKPKSQPVTKKNR